MNPIDLMSLYVAYLRALYQIHQNNHWKTKGNYGNHLLFQRLYEAVQEMADGAAEKTIGVFGDLNVSPEKIAEITEKFSTEDPVVSSLKAEKGFQALSTMVYDELEKADLLTLGIDDMIMSNANTSETHCYLLQQSLGNN